MKRVLSVFILFFILAGCQKELVNDNPDTNNGDGKGNDDNKKITVEELLSNINYDEGLSFTLDKHFNEVKQNMDYSSCSNFNQNEAMGYTLIASNVDNTVTITYSCTDKNFVSIESIEHFSINGYEFNLSYYYLNENGSFTLNNIMITTNNNFSIYLYSNGDVIKPTSIESINNYLRITTDNGIVYMFKDGYDIQINDYEYVLNYIERDANNRPIRYVNLFFNKQELNTENIKLYLDGVKKLKEQMESEDLVNINWDNVFQNINVILPDLVGYGYVLVEYYDNTNIISNLLGGLYQSEFIGTQNYGFNKIGDFYYYYSSYPVY